MTLADRVLKLDFGDKFVGVRIDLVEFRPQAGDFISFLAAEFAVFVDVGFGESGDKFFDAEGFGLLGVGTRARVGGGHAAGLRPQGRGGGQNGEGSSADNQVM